MHLAEFNDSVHPVPPRSLRQNLLPFGIFDRQAKSLHRSIESRDYF
jgi:hypothetical protein